MTPPVLEPFEPDTHFLLKQYGIFGSRPSELPRQTVDYRASARLLMLAILNRLRSVVPVPQLSRQVNRLQEK